MNLYIPSTVEWAGHGMKLRQSGGMPLQGEIRLEVLDAGAGKTSRLALRIPGWAGHGWSLKLNGRALKPTLADGYAVVERAWRKGDSIRLELPLQLRLESAPGDAHTVSVLRGPLVLAADLGPSKKPFDQPSPALVADGSLLGTFRAEPTAAAHYTSGASRPGGLHFTPFYNQYDRFSAMYFKRMDDAGWQREIKQRAEADAARKRLDEHAVDMIQFGDDASEKVHDLSSDTSFAGSYRRQTCRDVRGKGFVAFHMANAPGGPLVLRLRCWGGDSGRFRILINGNLAVDVSQKAADVAAFVDHDYPLPMQLTTGKILHVRIEPEHGDTAGPLFNGWLLRAQERRG